MKPNLKFGGLVFFLAVVLVASSVMAYIDVQCDTTCGSWTCTTGGITNAGTLSVTNATICIGDSVSSTLSGVGCTNGIKSRPCSDTCGHVWTDTQPVNYTINNWWEPVLPTTFTNTGTFYFTNKVQGISQDGDCPSTTAIVISGILTVTVSNSPPVISNQPTNQTVVVGSNATFTVTATGCPYLTYQWWFNGNLINNATNASLTVTNVQLTNAGPYYVTVTDPSGSINSTNAILSIAGLTATGPFNTIECPGLTATFSVNVAGCSPITYLWKFGTNVLVNDTNSAVTISSSSTNSLLTLYDVSASSVGTYTVIASGPCGSKTNSATLTVSTNLAVAGPSDLSVCAGTTATFGVTVFGSGPITYQWSVGTNVLSGQTNSTLSITNVASTNVGTYFVTVNGSCGSVIKSATLKVLSIISQPQNQSIIYGQSATFSVAVSGYNSPVYQWRKNGINIAGANSSSYTIVGAPVGVWGSYDVVVSSPDCSLTSSGATLTVAPATLLISADNQMRAYGQSNPTLNWSATGFVYGENKSVLYGTPSLNTVAATNGPVGNYAITITNGTLVPINYQLVFSNGTMTVTQAGLTIIVNDQIRTYGTTNPIFTWNAVGLLNGDRTSVIFGAPQITTPAMTNSVVNSYPINIAAGTLTATNYSFSVIGGTLVVTKAPLAVVAADKSKYTGATNPPLTGAITGIKNNDNITAGYSTIATQWSPAGFYPIVPSLVDPSGKLSNYSVSKTDGTLTISDCAPILLSQSSGNLQVNYGAIISLRVIVAGSSAVYQWKEGGTNVTLSNVGGTTTGWLTITNMMAGNFGTYTCVITNACGAITSAPIVLSLGDFQNGCPLYPIGLPKSIINAAYGSTNVITTDTNNPSGNFLWLAWDYTHSDANTLAASLQPPGNSASYINPSNTLDNVISIDDWISGNTGSKNTSSVKNALAALSTNNLISLPIWYNNPRGGGSSGYFQFYNYAQVRLVTNGWDLAGNNALITIVYYGDYQCEPTALYFSILDAFYTEKSSPIIIDQGANVSDFDIGTLTVWFVTNGLPEDILSITNQGTQPNQISISNSTVLYTFTNNYTQPIGTFTNGSGISPLQVTFNNNSTIDAVRATVRTLTYFNTNYYNPSTATRSVQAVLAHAGTTNIQAALFSIHILPINDPPSVQIISPSDAQTFPGGSAITLTALATDPDDLIDNVKFYINGSFLDYGVPIGNNQYQLLWTNAPLGTNKIYAIATDAQGAVTISSTNSVIVFHTIPTIFIVTPANNAQETALANLHLTSVAQADGIVTNVAYYMNSNYVGSSTVSPYILNLTNLLGGTYIFQAVVYDNRGLTNISPYVTNMVATPFPTVQIFQPHSNDVFVAGENILIGARANDVDDWITNVQFNAGNTFLGNVATAVSNNLYYITWTNATQASSINLYAIASDNDGLKATSSVPVSVQLPCQPSGISNFVLSAYEVQGGSVLTGTIILSNAATTGGQAIALSSPSFLLNLPPTVFIAEGQTSNSFPITTYAVSTTNTATISAQYHGMSKTAGVTIDPLTTGSTIIPQHCGPMDVVFVVDTTGSMGGSLDSVKNALTPTLNDIVTASGGDYRLGLVTFDGTSDNNACGSFISGDYVNVLQVFAQTNRDQVGNLIQNLDTGYGGDYAECSDEALNTVINTLSANDPSRNQCGDFTTPFRPMARKIVILVTDAAPGSFQDYFNETVRMNAIQRAYEAAAKGIEISAINVTYDWFDDPDKDEIMHFYADTTGGVYIEAPDGTGAGQAVDAIISQCGASDGGMVFVRDDKTRGYSPVVINSPQTGATATQLSQFDMGGLLGAVTQARLLRAGQVIGSSGSRFDAELGVADTNGQFNSFGILIPNANASSSHYSFEWPLPDSSLATIAGQMNSTCSLVLTNRVSSLCGTAYTLTDQPQQAWPAERDALTLEVKADRVIPQGSCRSMILTGTIGPANGSWDIVFHDQIIGSSGNPNGWDVEEDHTAFGGFVVTPSSTAVVDSGYKVRVFEPEWKTGRSSTFSVAQSNSIPTAPVLLPLFLSTNTVNSAGDAVQLSIALDSPAPYGDAYVTLNGPSVVSLPSYVVIPAGQKSTTISVPISFGPDGTLQITASYNGKRAAKLLAANGCQPPATTPQIQRIGTNDIGIILNWSPVSGASSYNVSRSTNGSSYSVIFNGLTTTNFVDTAVFPQVTYYYKIIALSNNCQSAPSSAASLTLPYPFVAPSPWIIPYGGVFNDQVTVLLTNYFSGSTNYYTTNGAAPTENSSFFVNGGVITLTSAATIQAFAENNHFVQPSRTVSAVFSIVKPAPINCGSNITSSLSSANAFSTFAGMGYYCARYVFTNTPTDIGKLVMVSASSDDFFPVLILKDASTNVLALNYDSIFTGTSEIDFHIRATGTNIIEVTSFWPWDTGNFNLKMDCEDTAGLNVFTNAYHGFTTNSGPILAGDLIDFGVIPIGIRVTNYITITNNGNANLVISNTVVDPDASDYGGNGFTIAPASAITIPPRGITNLAVSLYATNFSSWDGYFFFNSNDGDPATVPPQEPFWAEITGNVGSDPGKPFVIIFYPTNGTAVPATNGIITNVVLEIDAFVLDTNTISKVNFYTNNATSLFQTVFTAPYTVYWTNPPVGSQVIKAEAIDSVGNAGSNSVTINVGAPLLTIGPTNDCVGLSNSTFTATATLLDAAGNAVANSNVVFTVSGAHSFSYTNSTLANGKTNMTYTGTNAGPDQIVASAVVNGVSVQSSPIIKNWAKPISCGITNLGTLTNTSGFSIACGCSVPSHYTDFYSFSGSNGDVITLTMRSSDFATFLFVETNCVNLSVPVYSLNTNDTQVQFTLPATGTYVVEATSSDIFKTGNYSLTYQCGSTPAPRIAALVSGTNMPNYGLLNLGITTNFSTMTGNIVLTNKGNATLHITGWSLYYDTNGFSATVPNLTLSAGSSENVAIQFESSQSGQFADALVLNNDDPNQNPFVINLTAISNPDGTPPTVSIAAPTNNAQFIAPASVAISASATASTGANVTNVTFVFKNSQGTYLIGNAKTPASGTTYTVGWTEQSAGNYLLYALAYDNFGRIGIAGPTNVTIYPSTLNHPPVAVNDHPIVLANSANNVLDVLANDYDSDGDSLTITQIIPSTTSGSHGTAIIIDGGKHISYTPPPFVSSRDTNSPADGFSYQISDGKGGTALGGVYVVIYASPVPQISITNPVPKSTLTAGNTYNVMWTNWPADSLPNIVRVEFYDKDVKIGEVTNMPVNGTWPWFVQYDACQCGLKARVIDRFGQYSECLVQYTVNPPTDPNLPTPNANISYPSLLSQSPQPIAGEGPVERNAEVTDGILVVSGSVYQATNSGPHLPVQYKVLLKTSDGTVLRDSGWQPAADIENGPIWTNDLTTLQNDSYSVELIAQNNYQIAHDEVPFLLNSSLKIGVFTFSEQDMVIPAGGIPLSVVRTYNSLNPNLGSFGYSWTYALNDMNVAFHEDRGMSLFGDEDGTGPGYTGGDTFSMRIGGSRDITLTLPSGQRTTFYYYEQECDCYNTEMKNCACPAYYSPPGVHYTLRPVNENGSDVRGYDVYTGNWADLGWDSPPHESYDFPAFILTDTTDGTEYFIEREYVGTFFLYDDTMDPAYDDKARLAWIKKPSGEMVVIGADVSNQGGSQFSINYFDIRGTNTRSIYFQKNTKGQIVAIMDPTSGANGTPVVKYEYDANINLSKVERLVNRTAIPPTYTTNTYLYENGKFPHFLTKILDARGVAVARNLYDDTGKLIGVIDSTGETNLFVHNINGQTETIFDRMGNPMTYGYDTRGNVTTEIDALGHTTFNTYDDQNNLTSTTDALSNTTYYAYDGNGNRTAVTNALGEVILSAFDGSSRLIQKIDALGNATSFSYDSTGHRNQVIDALGNSTTFNHDSTGRPNAVTNALGQLRATAGSDNSGNLSFVNQVGGLQMNFGHDANGNTTNTSFTWTNPNNPADTRTLPTATERDAQGRETRVTDPDGMSRMTVYESTGRVAQNVDRMGNTNSYVYDANGNLIQTTYADGSVARSVYDADNRVIYSDDRHLPGIIPNGAHTIYDLVGRAVRAERLANVQIDIANDPNYAGLQQSVLTSAGAVISASSTLYDAASRVLAVTNAIGGVTRYEYDAVGRQTAVTDALGNRAENFYDDGGQLIVSVNAALQITRYEYDAKGRRIKTIFPDGSYTTNSYNAIGQLVFSQDQLGLETDYQYDNLGRMTNIIKPPVFDPEHNTTVSPHWGSQYDLYGNVLAMTDPKGRQTKFTYDALGELISKTLPLLQTNFNAYNPLGQVAWSADFKGQSNVMVYDSQGRMVTNFLYAAGWTTPGQTNVMIYDANGRMSQIIRPKGATTFKYNLDGQVTNIVSPEGWISYEYDPAMNYLTRTYTVNSDVRYGYDALSRLATVAVVKRDGAAVNPPEVTTNNYTALGSLQNVFYPNGVHAFYQYDVMNRLTNLTETSGSVLLAQYSYNLDAGGRRTNAVEILRQENGLYLTNSLTWRYDNLNRLTNEVLICSVSSASYTNSYSYDLAGNRLSKVHVGSSLEIITYQYSQNDELTNEVSSVNPTAAYLYDANGSLTNKTVGTTVNSYGYNLENKLATAGVNGITSATYQYDSQGIRISSTIGGSTTNYLIDANNLGGYSQILEELPTVGGTPSRSYVIGSGVLAQSSSGTSSYFLPDGHGNNRQLTDANGTVSSHYNYDAYGMVQSGISSTTAEAAPTSLLYCGQQYDSVLHMYNLRARYFDPATGRMNQQDSFEGTISDPQSLHKYVYCQNNPVNMSDPSGNQGMIDVMIATSIAADLEWDYNKEVLKQGYVASKKVTEIGAAYESIIDFATKFASSDTATIIVHGVAGHENGWSQSTETPFQQDLSLETGQTPIKGITGPALNTDFYEFDWGGFSISGLGLIPIKSVHEMALMHLQVAELYVSMNGYANINIISHSWGTTLTYDLLNNSDIEVHNWVTMGSPLKQGTSKPVKNTGKWINCYDLNDLVVHLEMFPPFPDVNGLPLPSWGPGLTIDKQIDVQLPYDFRSKYHHWWVHSDYFISPDTATDLRQWLQN